MKLKYTLSNDAAFRLRQLIQESDFEEGVIMHTEVGKRKSHVVLEVKATDKYSMNTINLQIDRMATRLACVYSEDIPETKTDKRMRDYFRYCASSLDDAYSEFINTCKVFQVIKPSEIPVTPINARKPRV